MVYDVFTGAARKPYVTILKDKGLLQCEVPGAFPKPTVEWKDSNGKTLPSKMVQDEEEQGRFHLTIQTTVTDPGCYRCIATQMEKWHQISSEICVHDGKCCCFVCFLLFCLINVKNNMWVNAYNELSVPRM